MSAEGTGAVGRTGDASVPIAKSPRGLDKGLVAPTSDTHRSPGTMTRMRGLRIPILVVVGLVVLSGFGIGPAHAQNGCGTNPPTTCTVTFTSNLPSGTKWSVTLNGSIQTAPPSPIQFSEPNGTYSYTASSAGYTAPGSQVTVSGLDVSVFVTFTVVTYTVTFTESGLPSGTRWYVNLTNGQSFTTTGTSTSFPEPNGSYTYSLGSADTSYSAPGGSFTVNGLPVSQSVTFSLVLYRVSFSETGLPTATVWFVNLTNGQSFSSASSSITFSEPNGSYTYTIATVNKEYTAPGGSFSVAGGPVSRTVTFTTVNFPVTFTESGLPPGTLWTVVLNNGQAFSSTTPTLSFSEPNGSYTYRVSTANSSYHPSPSSGTLTIAGAPVSVSVTFSLVTFSITFTESGLPTGHNWSVTIGAATVGSVTTTIVFFEPNGTYTYQVGVLSGWRANSYSGSVTVRGGSPAPIAITWTRVYYSVWFNETGLPAGTLWGMTFDTVPANTTGTSILYTAPNGTQTFSIRYMAGFYPTPGSGSFNITGSDTTVTIVWTEVVYSVTFYESGLPSGTPWSVNVSGRNGSATVPLITFSLPNATYNYTAGSAPGYVPYPPGGSFRVNGKALNVSVTYVNFAYLLEFNESGLAPGTVWSVTTDGVRHTSNTSSVQFHLANGSYSFLTGAVRGYSVSPASGNLNVQGANVVVAVNYTPIFYPVEFRENNLPTGLNWSVTLAGIQGTAPSGSPITFLKANGTYPYVAGSPLYFLALNASGNVTVRGNTVTVTITYTSVFESNVTFLETGLAAGTYWTVSAGPFSGSSSSTTLLLRLPNGTISYYLGYVPGYSLASSAGVLNVVGRPINVTVQFLPLAAGSTGPPHGFGLSEIEWIAVALTAADLALVVVVLDSRRRRKRESDGLPPPP